MVGLGIALGPGVIHILGGGGGCHHTASGFIWPPWIKCSPVHGSTIAPHLRLLMGNPALIRDSYYLPPIMGTFYLVGNSAHIYGFNGKIKIKSPTLKLFFRIGLAMK